MSNREQHIISMNPHVRAKNTTRSIMLDVIFALLPAVIFATVYFGWRVLMLIGISVAAAVLSEFGWQKLTKQKVTVGDCSAAVTGLLLALNLPYSAPWWIPLVGSAFAIIVVKQIFGGLGQNFMNPALAARCFLLISWTSIMTSFGVTVDGVSVATPLVAEHEAGIQATDYLRGFIGATPGCIGETSAMFLLLGGIYLLLRRVIDFRIPLAYIGTVFIFSYILGMDGIFQILSGGLFLGAIFMATDYVTSPMNKGGKWIFGIGCGLMTVLIRRFGGYPEGVSFSILFMNVCTPLIDRYIRPRAYGVSRKKGGA